MSFIKLTEQTALKSDTLKIIPSDYYNFLALITNFKNKKLDIEAVWTDEDKVEVISIQNGRILQYQKAFAHKSFVNYLNLLKHYNEKNF